MMKFILSSVFLIISLLFSQSSNFFNSRKYFNENSSINYHTNFNYFQNQIGKTKLNVKLDYYNSIINYNQKFKDNNVLFTFLKSNDFIPNFNYTFSIFIENHKKEPINLYSKFYNDHFNGITGDLEKSFINFSNDHFNCKIGRDYFLPGKYLNDRLMFSSIGYPYDQFIFTFIKDRLSITSFYLKLNNLIENNISYQRHINGRRINLNHNNGYLAIMETSIYGGENKNIESPLINPLNISYIYQMNNNFNLNSIISLEYLFQNKNYSVFIEFILDDIQIEKITSDDLEPAEFGFFLNFNKNINQFFNFNSSNVIISNRTFNAPVFQYEKLIYKNFPIGHILGNNFWKIENSIIYRIKNFSISGSYIYIEKGEEALFSTFNTDFLNYSIDEGYKEQFPFGVKSIMSGFYVEFDWMKYDNINFSTAISYWFNTHLDNAGINLSSSISYNYNF